MRFTRQTYALMAAVACCLLIASTVQAQFPAQGNDSFNSVGKFKITFVPGLGLAPIVIDVQGPTEVIRSSAHLDAGAAPDVSGPLGVAGSPCAGVPKAGTSDLQIGFHPGGYEGGGVNEVHTEICDMILTNAAGWQVLAGDSMSNPIRTLGEVESIGGVGFPANSFFNVFVEVVVPPAAGGMTVANAAPFTVEKKNINAFPPLGGAYVHDFGFVGKVKLYDTVTGCFVGWLEQGTHGVGTGTPNPLHLTGVDFPVVFSVNALAEGLLIPDPCAPNGHPQPNDIYSLSTIPAHAIFTPLGGAAGNAPGGHGYATQGELFQSSGAQLGARPDMTNMDRISAALGIGPAASGGGPPWMGPFPPLPAASPQPLPPGAASGTLGLVPGDNINAVSFGVDAGDTPLFSVDWNAAGLAGTAVEYHAQLSLQTGPVGTTPPSNSDGELATNGDEAAGDIYVGPSIAPWGGPMLVGAPFMMGLRAAPYGKNLLVYDDLDMGLQAPAIADSALGAPEDDLDALEADDAHRVDPNMDGQPDYVPGAAVPLGGFVFFCIDPASPTATLVSTADILVSNGAGGYAVYATEAQMGLQPGDDVDALALYDHDNQGLYNGPDGVLQIGGPFGGDRALFSLSAGSPSGGPGFIYSTTFTGTFVVYAQPGWLGLTAADELNALDMGWNFPGFEIPTEPEPWGGGDGDLDGIQDILDPCPGMPNAYMTFDEFDGTFYEMIDEDGDGCPVECDSDDDAYAPYPSCRAAAVPAVSEWGLLVIAVLVVMAGAVVIRRAKMTAG